MDVYGLPESLKARLAGRDRADDMYNTILVTLDGTPTDRAIIDHVKQLAR